MTNQLEVVQGQVFDIIGVQDMVIAEMNKQYLPMKINGIEDKAGYKKVHEGLMLYVKIRGDVARHGKKMREDAVRYQKDVISEEKRIIALLAIGEEHLAAERKTVDDALEAIKQEKVRQEELRIQARRDRLVGLDIRFNGQMWSYKELNLPEAMLKTALDDQFEVFYQKFSEAITTDKALLAAEEAKRKEEEERLAKIAADQEAERVRLDVLRQEQEKKERALAEEAKRLADMEEARKRDAQKIIDDKLRTEEMERAKLEAAEKATLETEARIKREAEEKAEKERLAKVEQDKKEARKPDKEKLLSFAGVVAGMIPKLKTIEAKNIIIEFEKAIDALKQKAEAL